MIKDNACLMLYLAVKKKSKIKIDDTLAKRGNKNNVLYINIYLGVENIKKTKMEV